MNSVPRSQTKALSAVLYLRVSTDKQAEEGTSLDTQEALCRQKAQQLGAEVVAVIRDEGISGASYLSRPGIQQTLALIEQEQANLLICANLSRYSRDVEHQQAIKRRIEQAGAQLVFCDMNFDATPEGDLAFGILGNFAAYERQVIRSRTMKGRKKRAEEGYMPMRNVSPFGYHIVTKEDVLTGRYPADMLGRYTHVEGHADYAREIFRRYAAGASLRGICTWLDTEGVPTSQGGNGWHASTIRKILLNPVYKGEAMFGKTYVVTDETRSERTYKGRKLKLTYYMRSRAAEECIRIEAPALTDADTWAQCQVRLRENNDRLGGNPTRTYLLRGLVYCPQCNLRMAGRPGKKYLYYSCAPQRKCSNTHFRAEQVEMTVKAAMMILAHRPELVADAVRAYEADQRQPASSVDTDRLRQELSDLEAQEKATAAAQVDAIMKRRSTQVYDRLLDDIEAKRQAVQAKLSAAAPQSQDAEPMDPKTEAEKVAAVLADVETTLLSEELTSAEKNRILSNVIRSIRPEEGKFWHIETVPIIPNGKTVHLICPWCWVAWQQAKRLREEFPALTLRWVGYELLPAGLEYNPPPPDPDADKKPRIPTRFELLLAADGLTLPERTHGSFNSRLALEGAEFAADAGKADAYLDALYHAYWEEDRDISDKTVLAEIAESAGLDITAFLTTLEEHTYRDRVVEFDAPAHAKGIWNVPTWMFPEEWIAEQPYRVVRAYAERFVRDMEAKDSAHLQAAG